MYLNIISNKNTSKDFFIDIILNYYNDKKINYRFYFYARKKENNYYNVAIPDHKNFLYYVIDEQTVEQNNDFKIFTSDRKLINKEQEIYNINNNIKTDEQSKINYNYIDNKSQKLIVTLPDFSNIENVNFNIEELFLNTKQANVLNLQENSFLKGSFFQIDNDGSILFKNLIKFIQKIIDQLEIREENVIFYGKQKGASIVLKLTKYFPKANFIANSPILSFDYFINQNSMLSNENMHLLKVFLKESNFDYKSELNLKYDLDIIKGKENLLVLNGKFDFLRNSLYPKYKQFLTFNYNDVQMLQNTEGFVKDVVNNLISGKKLIKEYYSKEAFLVKNNNLEIQKNNTNIEVSQVMIKNIIKNSEKNINEVDKEITPSIKDKKINYRFLHFEINKAFLDNDFNYIKIFNKDELIYHFYLTAKNDFKTISNIILPSNQEINIETNLAKEEYNFEFSNDEKYSVLEARKNSNFKTLKIDGVNIYYDNVDSKKPENLIFVFPYDQIIKTNWKYYPFPNKFQDLEKNPKNKIIYLQDRYFYQGSFFISDNNGKEIWKSLANFVKLQQVKHNVKEENITFVTNNKYSYISLLMFNSFENSKFIFLNPQRNIDSFNYLNVDKEDTRITNLNYLLSENKINWRNFNVTKEIKKLNKKSIVFQYDNNTINNNFNFKKQNSNYRNFINLSNSPSNFFLEESIWFWKQELINFKEEITDFSIEELNQNLQEFTIKAKAINNEVYEDVKENSFVKIIFYNFEEQKETFEFPGTLEIGNRKIFNIISFKNDLSNFINTQKLYKIKIEVFNSIENKKYFGFLKDKGKDLIFDFKKNKLYLN